MLVGALGCAVTVVVAILLVQVMYLEGDGGPLQSLSEPDMRNAVSLSLLTATSASLIAMLVSLPSAYALARWQFRGRVLVDALLDIPIVLSPIVVGIALILVFRSRPGMWIEEHLVRFVFEVPGIILAQFVLALALQVRVLKAAFEEIDPRYEQVARFLGCTPWGAFWRVSLPMAKSSVFAAFVLGWCRALGDFGASVTVAGAVRNKTETIPVAIYNNLSSVRIAKALGLSVLMTCIALGVLLVVRIATKRRSHG